MAVSSALGIAVGLAAEARVALGLSPLVEAGGGDAAGAAAAAERLVAKGAAALLSFGLAGGLAPGLAAGAIVVPLTVLGEDGQAWPTDPVLARRFAIPDGAVLAADTVLVTAAAKRAAWEATGARAADIESGAVARVAARHRLPFAVVRAICDPAKRTLPQAALVALDAQGRISMPALLGSLARDPGQIPALIALGREAALARRSLLALVTATGRI